MTDQVQLIKQSLQIAIGERIADCEIFQKSSVLLGHSHDLQWVLTNVMTNLIMDRVDGGEEVCPAQFMETLSRDVGDWFAALV
jgi:hypothetical protein